MRTARHRLTVWLPLDGRLVVNRTAHPMRITMASPSEINDAIRERAQQQEQQRGRERRGQYRFNSSSSSSSASFASKSSDHRPIDVYPGITDRVTAVADSSKAAAASAAAAVDLSYFDAVELYDLKVNPGENVNVATDREYASTLRKLLVMWHGGWPAQQHIYI